jgi:hypothetical protein
VKTKKGRPYCIAFQTDEVPGKITGISVQLDKIFLHPDDVVQLDLRRHPLYHYLATYVRDNPPARQKEDS